MMTRPFATREFKKQLKSLVDQLFIANIHFHIASGLRKNWREYFDEIAPAHVFWHYTIHAHDTVAVVRLCRVYDLTKSGGTSGLTLPRFIATVAGDPIILQKPALQDRIKEDSEFCRCDAAIKRLMDLRNNVVMHANYEFSIGEKRDYSRLNPFPYDQIRRLIDRGFEILNRYSSIYLDKVYSERLASRQDQDYLNVLSGLRDRRINEKVSSNRTDTRTN